MITVRTQCGSWRWLRSIVAAVLLLPGVTHFAYANSDRPSPRFAFAIPAEPLATALATFEAISGEQVLYETEAAAGLMSAPVTGEYGAEAALLALVDGTGLAVKRAGGGAFVLSRRGERGHAATLNLPFVDGNAQAFWGALQAKVLGALCDTAGTRPGGYRAAVQFWINPGGVIVRSEVAGTSGDSERDVAISDVLRALPLGIIPPASLSQPITMIILPRNYTHECESAHRGR